MKNFTGRSSNASQYSLVAQLRARLILTVGVLVCCLLLSSAIEIVVAINQQMLGDQKVTINQEIGVLLQSMVDQETGLRGYVATNNPTFLEPLTSGRAQYSSTLQSLQAQATGTNFSATNSALTQVNAQATNWSTTFADTQLAEMQSGRLNAARSGAFNAQGKALFDTFRHTVTQLQQAASSDLTNIQVQENTVDFGALAGALLLTIVAVAWLWRTFSRFSQAQRNQLEILKQTAAAFGAGDLSARAEHVTNVDLRELSDSFNTMANKLQEQQNALKDRDILEQVSHLNATLTGSPDLSEIMQNFLSSMLPALNVQMGVLYLYDPDKKQLNLFASRGLRAEDLQASFDLGEGLVGRAALDRQPLMLTQSEQRPDKGFLIKTMLGQVLPSSLYHLPLLRGQDLLGVLVVGSLYPMREQTRNVLNVVASNLAAVTSNAQAYMHIQEQAHELAERSREQERSNQALVHQRDELTVLNQALEEANRARSQFLSTMSHELRTPLTSVIGFSQMLLRTSPKSSLNERQRANVERILKNAEHLLTLINDVLDLAKIEAGRMDVNTSEVNLKQLLTTLIDETRSIALERKLNLSVSVEDDLTSIETDPTKLRQIVLNLVSNALKFTEKGQVTVTATRRRPAQPYSKGKGESEQVKIAVKDTGIGISPEQQERIFEAFYQADNSNSRSYGGTGLGLSIVRELTTLLGGKVEIASQPGVGTTFTVLLPIRARDRQSVQDTRLNTIHGQMPAARRPVPAPISKEETENDSYLVVAIDDNPDVLQLIKASLEQSPYRVVGVQDSTQAISIIQKLRPHAITLDIMMPRVNGWQILHQLKSNPATATIPVILLTVLEDRSAGYVLGADEYLVKPVARDALLATLRHLTASFPSNGQVTDISKQQSATDITESSTFDELKDRLKHILLVNSAPHVHNIIDHLVTDRGYILQTANEGQDLMTMIEQVSPDLLMILVQLGEQTGGTHIIDANNAPTLPPPEQDNAHET
ncbi:MAG: ATP-binding protein [Chloroflexota bacterium]|nr:ATP-binding protein [Chloroflexota bacterium]